MPLDPQCEAVLVVLRSMGLPAMEGMSLEAARALFSPAPFSMLMGAGGEVSATTSVVIPGPGGDLLALVSRPAGDGPFPVLVYFHGGGFVLGSAELVEPVCRSLAARAGCLVVNVDYRLAPENPYPAAVEDAYAAVAWAAEHADEIGGDGRRLAVAGDSAGGALAAAVALMARDRGGPHLALQVLIYPVTDHTLSQASYHENGEGLLLTTAGMRAFWEHYAGDESQRSQPYAAPLRAPDVSGTAPAVVFTCEMDPLRDEGEEYAHRLRLAGVPTQVKRYDGAIHGIFWMAAVTACGAKMGEDVADAVKAAFATAP